ncbi:hypothetical protein [Paenibacillus sp. Marseille-Q7038]
MLIEIDGQIHDVSKSTVDASFKVGKFVTLVEGVMEAKSDGNKARERSKSRSLWTMFGKIDQ